MSNQQIIVYIEEAQLIAQKINNYSLFLAKKVNNTFTVIWLSKAPKATTGQPSYQYKNIFDISDASFMVNFTSAPLQEGDITFTSGGKNLPINTGQITTLNEYLSLIHISEPTRRYAISYAVFCCQALCRFARNPNTTVIVSNCLAFSVVYRGDIKIRYIGRN